MYVCRLIDSHEFTQSRGKSWVMSSSWQLCRSISVIPRCSRDNDRFLLNLTGSLTLALIRPHFSAIALACKLNCSLLVVLEEETWFMPTDTAQTGDEWLQLIWDGGDMLYPLPNLLWIALVQNIPLFQTNKNSPRYVCVLQDAGYSAGNHEGSVMSPPSWILGSCLCPHSIYHLLFRAWAFRPK